MIKSGVLARRVRRYALALLALAGLAAAAPAFADQLYQADRAYCMRGEATEARSLCLKEAAAALADRQRTAQRGPAKRHAKHQAAARSKSADKGASAASS